MRLGAPPLPPSRLPPQPPLTPILPHPAARSKRTDRQWTPSNVAFMGHKYPSTAIDNWAAAHKFRRHWEDRTEQRKAAGKTTF